MITNLKDRIYKRWCDRCEKPFYVIGKKYCTVCKKCNTQIGVRNYYLEDVENEDKKNKNR